MLRRIIDEGWISANGVFGFWRAQRSGSDDIDLFDGTESRYTDRNTCTICANNRRKAQKVRTSRSPTSSPRRRTSTMSARSPSTREPASKHGVAKFEAANDDYNAIMLKALADRLAEAFAERLHERVRKEFWGYSRDETLTTDELIAESYRGIRPAPGYPACPDHTEKATLFALLEPERASMTLTEHFAMLPAAAVAGWYFSHPERPLLRRRQDRSRSGRRLRASKRCADRGSGTLAQTQPGVLSDARSDRSGNEVYRRQNERNEDRQHRHDIGFFIAPVLGFGIGHGGLAVAD